MALLLAVAALGMPFGVTHHHAHHRRPRHRHHEASHRADPYTGYTVEGYVSTYGALTGSSEGATADGGTTDRPCIAIRDDSTLDHYFRVTLYASAAKRRGEVMGHPATLIHCDWGPAAFTGRAVDITGPGDYALGVSPYAFPTSPPGSTWAVAKELKSP